MLSKILMGVILVMGLSGWFLYNKNIELQRLNSAFGLRDAEQKQTIATIKESYETQGKALSELTTKNAEIEGEMNRYLDIFRRHNLTKLAAAKPGLIEPRINNATKEVFDGIKNDSKLISDLSSN
jgi:hypothetical protein